MASAHADTPISRQEWIGLAVATGLLVLLSLLPALYVQLATPDTHVFSGFLVNGRDGHSYVAKLRQGYDGQWLFTLPYTAEPHDGMLVYPQYLALGQFARLAGGSLVAWFHVARAVSGAALLVALYALAAALTPDRRARRWAWAVMAAGGGLGLFALPLGIESADLTMPEAFAFFGMLANPHFSLAAALSIVLVLAVVAWPVLAAAWRGATIVTTAVLLALISPFTLPALAVGLLTGAAVQWVETRRLPTALLWRGALLALVVGAVAAYDLWALRHNPALAAWAANNQTPSPPPLDYLFGFGPLLAFAVFGWWRTRGDADSTTALHWVLAGWLLAAALLVYAPISLQRRVLGGVFVPLGALAGLGAAAFVALRATRAWRALATALVALTVFLTAPLLLLVLSQAPRELDTPAFYTRDEAAALDWLAGNATRDDVVLASETFSNWVPAHSSARVVYGHPYEVIDAARKQSYVEGFFGGTLTGSARQAMLHGQAVTLVVIGPREQALAAGTAGPDTADLLAVFTTETVVIYALVAD